jgi:imidazolonepropionase-like amidohydrolase
MTKTKKIMKKHFYLVALMGISTSVLAQKTILHCGSLVDGIGNAPRSQVSVLVEKNKIVAIESGYIEAQAGDKVVDLKTKTVMPGLIDMHVHIENETRRDQIAYRVGSTTADVAYDAQRYANITLMAGFTTVRDMGGSGVNIALRNAINQGKVVGCRIFTAGKTIATTGGHGDPTNGIKGNLTLPDEVSNGVINSEDEARQAVRQRYKDGSDWIKITATGGVLSIAKNGRAPQFTDAELRGIVSTANDYGFKVAAHAHGAEGMKRALRAGVTTIEHGTFMDDEAIALFKEKGAYLVPTIIAGKSTADSAKIMGYYHPLVQAKALETGSYIQATFAKAYKAGVKIVFGTDAGVFAHGKNAKEFEYMTEAGMPMMDCLKAATIVAADLLGMKEQLGSIEKGKIADIVAVEGDPIKDPKLMMNMGFVMKEGVIYKQK